MDAVYIVRPGDDNEELRYSIRSLQNLPVDNVHIVGYKPQWLHGVNHIPVEQTEINSAKQLNARRNMLAAMHSRDIDDEFVLMNDDFYVMKPQSKLPNYHQGTEQQVFENLAPGLRHTPHWHGFRATLTVLRDFGYDNPLCYSLHVPIVIKKDFYVEAMRITAPPHFTSSLAPHVRTVYGNLAQLGGEYMPVDCKWYFTQDPITERFLDQDFASSSDNSFLGSRGNYVKSCFSEPSKYEKACCGNSVCKGCAAHRQNR